MKLNWCVNLRIYKIEKIANIYTFWQRNVVVDEYFSGTGDVNEDGHGFVVDGVLAARKGQDAFLEDELDGAAILSHDVSLETS